LLYFCGAVCNRGETPVVQGPEPFWKAQGKIFQLLEEQFYPSFLLSDLFHSYTKKKSEGQIQDYKPIILKLIVSKRFI